MVTIKDKYLRILSCLVILVLGIFLIPVASASDIPSIPNVFEGKLITEGADVPTGTIISAYIDSQLAGSNSIDETGKYEIGVSGTEEDNGKKIVFKLGLVESEPVSVTYQHGAAPVELDLTFKLPTTVITSGGSGGRAVGSPEPQSNVEAKELSMAVVTRGTKVRFDFPNGVTCIRYVEFDARKTLGRITTIAEMLKGQSKLVSSLPEGTVYKNVNIWVGSGGIANSDNFENAVIGFRVNKTWLEENKVDMDSLSLWYYNDSWSELKTMKIDEENDTYVYFEARTPGFGPFVIVAPNEEEEEAGSIDVEPVPTETSEDDVESEPEKPASSAPGFELTAVLGTVGATYCVLRRKF